MFHKHHHLVMIITYFLIVMLLLGFAKKPTRPVKYGFLVLGLIGQVLLFYISYYIYKSGQIWYAFYMYALMYILYILSFTSTDIYLYLNDHSNFTGKIYKNIHRMFADFVYVNFCTVSTMGCNDISPATTTTRLYSSYKIAMSIFMIVFLVSDIVVKTK